MLSLMVEKSRGDGGRVERAGRSRSIHAAVLVIQLSLEKAFPRVFWPVAHARTNRSTKLPDGSKSVLHPSVKRLISSKRWLREVLFRQQSRDQTRSRTQSDGVTTSSRCSSARRVPPNVEDAVWMNTLAKEEDLVIVTADVAISRNPHEVKAWKESGARSVFSQPRMD